MSKLVEDKLGKDIDKNKRGSILYNRFSKSRTHYISLFTYYIRKHLVLKEKGTPVFEDETVITFLTYSLLRNDNESGKFS